MPDPSRTSDLRRIVSVLSQHEVEFIVIGGQAEILMGSPRVTYDVDVCYRNDAVNSPRMANALRELGVTLRGAPSDLPFIIDGRTLTMGNNFTFDVGALGFDILGYVEPLGDFDAVARNATRYDLDGVPVRVIALDDLITIKRHINRSKDRDSLFQLLAIKRIRAESGGEVLPKPDP